MSVMNESFRVGFVVAPFDPNYVVLFPTTTTHVTTSANVIIMVFSKHTSTVILLSFFFLTENSNFTFNYLLRIV